MKSSSAILAGALFILGEASAQYGMPPVIDPAAYASPDGVFRLEVDPSDIFGVGPARYRLTRRGTVVWSGQRPFTLVDAGVDDKGAVAGYAYEDSPMGNGAIHLVVLGPTGSVRLDEPIPRVESLQVHAGPEPTVLGMVFDPENDRVVFRLRHWGRDPETWRTYRLSDGKALSSLQPTRLNDHPGVGAWLANARAVRGTSLILAHWSLQGWRGNGSGAGFTLMDGGGRTVWSLNLDTLPTVLNDPAMDRSVIASTVPGSFEIRSFAPSEIVTFTVQQDSTQSWRVSEARRRPYVAPPSTARPLTGLMDAHRDLKYLGQTPLNGAGLDDASAWAVDAAGRAYVANGRTGTIHVFDQSGRPLRTCKPSPDDVSQILGVPQLTVAPDGRLVAQVKEEDRYREPVPVEFSSDCKRSVRLTVSAWEIHANPVTGGLWAARSQDVAAVDRRGVVTKTVSRRLDRRWFRSVRYTMVGLDGSLAVASSDTWDSDVWYLDILSSNGVPKQQLALPGELEGESFGYDGKRVALWQGDEVRILNLASLSLIALKPTFDVADCKRLPLMVVAGGRELWMLDAVRRVIHRFEMP